MKLIKKGEIDAAIGKLREWYPHIVQVDCWIFLGFLSKNYGKTINFFFSLNWDVNCDHLNFTFLGSVWGQKHHKVVFFMEA